MDIFDKFFKKYSYKFDKGYPDLNNDQDILLLESILENIGVPFKLSEALSAEAKEAKEILKQNFDLEEDNFLEMTSTSFKVLMDNSERRDFLKKADELDDFDFELKGASVGRLLYQPEGQSRPIYIYAKPANVQGLGSAGKQN